MTKIRTRVYWHHFNWEHVGTQLSVSQRKMKKSIRLQHKLVNSVNLGLISEDSLVEAELNSSWSELTNSPEFNSSQTVQRRTGHELGQSTGPRTILIPQICRISEGDHPIGSSLKFAMLYLVLCNILRTICQPQISATICICDHLWTKTSANICSVTMFADVLWLSGHRRKAAYSRVCGLLRSQDALELHL